MSDEMSEAAKEALRLLGNFTPTIHAPDRWVKGYVEGEEGAEKAYYSADDLRRFATGLNDAANWLDTRAARTPQEKPAARSPSDTEQK